MHPSEEENETVEGLLRQYRCTGAERVLRQLIVRYLPLVYSTALRRMGSETLAADVTQEVFCDFARQARALPDGFQPGGWLLKHTGFRASRALRTERRRAARETEAARRHQLTSAPAMSTPLHLDLDAAMQRLPAPDQTLLVLKFYEGQEVSAIAEVLGISRLAAQKRIERALERLRRLMPGRPSVPVLTGGLALLLAGREAGAAMSSPIVGSVTAAALSAASRPLPVWSVRWRHLSPAGGAVAGSAAALLLSAIPLVPSISSRMRSAQEMQPATAPGSRPVMAAAIPQKPAAAVPTAASVVDELIALVEREGYNRITYRKADSLIDKIPREQTGEAVVLLTQAFPVRRFFANSGGPERWPDVLLYQWKPEDPPAALAFVLPKLTPGLRDAAAFNLCQEWYRQNPAAATGWWKKLLADTSGSILPEDCRKIVVRRLGYWVLEALQKENLSLAIETARRMEEQEIKTLVSSQSSESLQAQAKREEIRASFPPAPAWEEDMKVSRRALALNQPDDRVAGALAIKDEALRDYTLAAMVLRDLDGTRITRSSVIDNASLPPVLAQNLREWLALQP